MFFFFFFFNDKFEPRDGEDLKKKEAHFGERLLSRSTVRMGGVRFLKEFLGIGGQDVGAIRGGVTC